MRTFIDASGHVRWLGNISPITDPDKVPLKGAFGVYGDTQQAKMIARAKWPELILAQDKQSTWLTEPYVDYIHDQDGIGQCNADATVSAMEDCRLLAGLPPVKLSAADLYMRINGGGDNGSTLEDGIVEAMKGVGTAATAGLIWQRGQRGATASERALYRVTEAWLCPTFDHCMSAVLCNFRLITGIMWYGNFNADGDGWLPKRGSGSPGGHAIKGYRGMMHKDGTFGIAHCNSWSTSYGVQGRMIIPSTLYGSTIGGWWAVRDMVQEQADLPELKH